jgi:hypothetical protein
MYHFPIKGEAKELENYIINTQCLEMTIYGISFRIIVFFILKQDIMVLRYTEKF